MPTFTTPDSEIYYELAGETGPPLLLIQGVGVTGGAWRRQVEGLSQNHRTLIFDNRGIGRSRRVAGSLSIEAMAADTQALMDVVGWESAHVAGHSMGGIIAQQLALDSPKRVRSLALVCTFSRGADAARITPWVLWMGLRTRLGTPRMRRHAFLGMLYSRTHLAHVDRDALAEETGELIGRDLATSPPILMQQLRACARHNIRDRLQTLSPIPTLVVSAESDAIARPSYGRDLAAVIPGATYLEQSGVAHGNLLEQPAWLNLQLARHIASVEAAR